MANYSGTIYTVYAAPSTPNTWNTPGYRDGRIKVNLDFYIGLGTELAGSVLYMGGPLPAGAKVLSIDVITSAATSALTMSVGDLNSATRYANADTGPASKGKTSYTGMIDTTNGWYVIGTNVGTGATAATTGDAQIILTTAGATLGTGTIYGCQVTYTTD